MKIRTIAGLTIAVVASATSFSSMAENQPFTVSVSPFYQKGARVHGAGLDKNVKQVLGVRGQVQKLSEANNDFRYGVEAGLNLHSPVKHDNSFAKYETRRSSADLMGVVDYKIVDKFSVAPKAGLAYVHEKNKSSFNVLNAPVSVKSTGNAFVPKVSVGAGYDFTDNVNLGVTWAKSFKSGSKVSAIETLQVLNLNYRFA